MRFGCLHFSPGIADHSWKPSVEIRQRVRASAPFHNPLAETVPARALIGGGAFDLLIHPGWNPQVISARTGTPASRSTTSNTDCDGAMLNRGMALGIGAAIVFGARAPHIVRRAW